MSTILYVRVNHGPTNIHVLTLRVIQILSILNRRATRSSGGIIVYIKDGLRKGVTLVKTQLTVLYR